MSSSFRRPETDPAYTTGGASDAEVEAIRAVLASANAQEIADRLAAVSAEQAQRIAADLLKQDAATAATDIELAAAAGPQIPRLEAYGHSLIVPAGVPNARYGFVERLAQMLGVPAANITKQAVSGGKVADIAASGGVANLLNNQLARDLTTGRYVTRGGLKIASIGGNDRALYAASGANGNALVEAAIRLAFSAQLSARIIPVLASGTTFNDAAHGGPLVFGGGTWNLLANTTLSLAPGEAYIGTNGAWIEFVLDAFYAGEAITAIIVFSTTTDYAATLSVNGVDKVSLDGSGMQTALNAGIAGGGSGGAALALRLPPGNAVAGNTVRITVSDMSGGKLAGISGFAIEGHDPPPLLLPTIPLQPSNPSNQNASAAYQKARVAAVAPEFPSAVVVDLDNLLSDEGLWSQSGQQSFAAGHPNPAGYEKIAAALYPTARALVTPAVAARMNA